MPHRDYFYETIYPIGIEPSRLWLRNFFLLVSRKSFKSSRILCASSKRLPRMYLPKYELLVSTQKIAKGSIILSQIPSSPCYLNLFTSISLLFISTQNFTLWTLFSFRFNQKTLGVSWSGGRQRLGKASSDPSSAFSSFLEFQVFSFSTPQRTRINSLCKM